MVKISNPTDEKWDDFFIQGLSTERVFDERNFERRKIIAGLKSKVAFGACI